MERTKSVDEEIAELIEDTGREDDYEDAEIDEVEQSKTTKRPTRAKAVRGAATRGHSAGRGQRAATRSRAKSKPTEETEKVDDDELADFFVPPYPLEPEVTVTDGARRDKAQVIERREVKDIIKEALAEVVKEEKVDVKVMPIGAGKSDSKDKASGRSRNRKWSEEVTEDDKIDARVTGTKDGVTDGSKSRPKDVLKKISRAAKSNSAATRETAKGDTVKNGSKSSIDKDDKSDKAARVAKDDNQGRNDKTAKTDSVDRRDDKDDDKTQRKSDSSKQKQRKQKSKSRKSDTGSEEDTDQNRSRSNSDQDSDARVGKSGRKLKGASKTCKDSKQKSSKHGKSNSKTKHKHVLSSESSESETSESEDTETSDSDESDKRAKSEKKKKQTTQRVKELTLDNFDGKPGGTSVGTYLAHFKVVARRNGWPEDMWADELAARLRGAAEELILPEENSRVPSFDKMVRKLKRHFGGDHDPSSYESLLHSREKKDKETIPELEHWIRVTGRRAYPDTPSRTLERLLKNAFQDALNVEDQRLYVKRAEPTTLSEAAKAALRWEAIHRSERHRDKVMGEPKKVRVNVQQVTVGETDHSDDEEERTKSDRRRLSRSEKRALRKERLKSRGGTTDDDQEDGGARVAQTTNVKDQSRSKEQPATAAGLTMDDLMKALAAMGSARQQEGGASAPARQAQQYNRPRPVGHCYNCGKAGHVARDCWTPRGCHNCGDTDHASKDCQKGYRCYNCQNFGHLARDCKEQPKCVRCGQIGHRVADCRQAAGQGNGKGSSQSGLTAPPKDAK